MISQPQVPTCRPWLLSGHDQNRYSRPPYLVSCLSSKLKHVWYGANTEEKKNIEYVSYLVVIHIGLTGYELQLITLLIELLSPVVNGFIENLLIALASHAGIKFVMNERESIAELSLCWPSELTQISSWAHFVQPLG